MRICSILLLYSLCLGSVLAQGTLSRGDLAAVPASPETENTLQPSWETQKQARTYLLNIPAPRGQIVDRNGNPLAQNRVSYNLALKFPTPANYTETQLLSFVRIQLQQVEKLLHRQISVDEKALLQHYKNRAVLPFDVARDLLPSEIELIKQQPPDHVVLNAVYLRFYPNAKLAGHVIGYAGRAGRTPSGPVQNNDPMFPDSEGREGLEQTFDEQLKGKPGQYNITVDSKGHVASERVSIPPQPGYNVVTTLDEGIQRLCEETLAKKAKRGAIVVLDPNTGDILAMASWPVFNPNQFIPGITQAEFDALQNDPNIPLLPRAYRSAYPPGSTFKVVTGLAALSTGTIGIHDEFSCPPSFSLGRLTFRNWKKEHAGMLTFAQALTQSCNTWFYQVGIKTGAGPIIDWAHRLGFAAKTGIPLNAETEGRIPTDDYMMKTYNRRIMDGDVANMSIGQGDILISPLQMAQAMAVVGNGGWLFQTRLVRQVQSIDNQIVTAYEVRARDRVDIQPRILAELKKAMVDVVSSRSGTAGRASVNNVDVAGKTGTAQWGPKRNERTAAWFAGYAPAAEPRYAFAAVYEGAPGEDVHGGSSAAPMIGTILKQLFKKPKAEEKPEEGDDDTSQQATDGD